MAYQLQIEPQGLKPLAKRHCGMTMKDYNDLVAPVEGQLVWDWLKKAQEHDFGPAEERLKWKGGKYSISKGWTINRKIIRLLQDLDIGKAIPSEVKKKRILKKDGWHTDDLAKVEAIVGPLPDAHLQDVPLDAAIEYASKDPDATLRVHPILKDMCSVMSLDKSLEIDINVIPMIEHMQTHGIQCDTQYLKDFSEELQRGLDRLTYEAGKITNRFINLNSGDQMAAQFYTRNWSGIPIPKYKTESGRPKMDEAALKTIKVELEAKSYRTEVQDKVIRLIDFALDYREHLKLKTTYADPIAKIVDASGDGRLHSNFRITKVVSGRLSATQPNVLAFPSRTELGKRIKAAFHASHGHTMGTWDYSGIEMRVMAHLSQDPLMMKVFQEGRDLHSETASAIFGKPIDQIDKMTERYPAKSMGFLIIYGGGASTLQDNIKVVGLDWPLDKCEELIQEWLKVYGGVKKFMDHMEAYAKRHGFVRTMHGRIRYLPGICSEVYRVQQEARRMAINHPIQGTAQEIIKIAMAKLWPILQELWTDGFSIHPLLQIHDELVMEFEDGIWDFVNQLMVDTMEGAVELSVPVKVGGDSGQTWKDLDK
jgi:DNA polymerase-1